MANRRTRRVRNEQISPRLVTSQGDDDIVIPAAPKDYTGWDPMHDMVLIRRDRQGKTAGGLFVPESAQDRRGEAVVIAAGPGKWSGGGFVKMTVKAGDRVLVNPAADVFEMPDDSAVCLVREADIIVRFAPPAQPEPDTEAA